ncbi:MAG: glycosyltransferase [Candidatus Lokiarchaeota archaeon]|nr:glycosyltransferase [Candidatus Lokiarchaeota archaeon]
MNILICSNGNLHQLLIYAKSFSKQGHNVVFLNPVWKNPLYPYDEQLEKYNIRFYTYDEFYQHMFLYGWNEHEGYDFDVIFSPNHSAVTYAFEIKNRLDIPVLQQILDIPTELFSWKNIGEGYKIKHKPFMDLYPKMDALTGINKCVPGQIEELCGRKDCHYIPYPIDTELFDNGIDYPVSLGDKIDVVFCISRLEPYKGVDILIEACHDIFGLNLKVAGYGSMFDDLYNMTLRKKTLCSFMKTIDDSQKDFWLKKSKVVIYPQTWSQAPGIVSQEALYCHTVPVCFAYDSQKDLDGNFGIYAELPPSADGLRVAIEKALHVVDNFNYQKSHDYVKYNLSGDVVSEKILTVLKGLV